MGNGVMSLLDPERAQRFEVEGHGLRCQVCGGELFWERKFKLNTTAMELFNLGWANETATCYVCDECGQILWFAL
jgi:uncharacterized protein with PIN domain